MPNCTSRPWGYSSEHNRHNFNSCEAYILVGQGWTADKAYTSKYLVLPMTRSDEKKHEDWLEGRDGQAEQGVGLSYTGDQGSPPALDVSKLGVFSEDNRGKAQSGQQG